MLKILGNCAVTLGFLENIIVKNGSLEFEWKIPDFFSRGSKHNYRVQSPQIEFLGVELSVKLISGRTDYYIYIACKMKDGYSDLRANYSIEIKCSDGTAYKSVRGAMALRPVFCATDNKLFSSLSSLMRDRVKISPSDVLTIPCSLSIVKEHCEETAAYSSAKTEIFEGIHASTQVTEKHLDQAANEESNGIDAVLGLEGTSKLIEDLKGLLLNGTHFDVTIKISDREFRAHRAILGARSSVFQSMFSHDTTERNTGTIEIEDCDPDVFQDFLLFLYTGKLQKLCSENMLHLHSLAVKYDVHEMKKVCLKFMTHNFNVDTFCDVLALALGRNEVELLEKATDFFMKNPQKVIFSTKWQSFLKQYPVECNELYIKAIQFRDH